MEKLARFRMVLSPMLMTRTLCIVACLPLLFTFAQAYPSLVSPSSSFLANAFSRRQEGGGGAAADGEGGAAGGVIDVLRKQMQNPAEIMAVLLIIGGDIVQKAIAQMAGTRVMPGIHLTPVAFSFGWVAYTFSATMAVFGDGRLMPTPEDELFVVNLRSGTRKKNESWVLFRLVRDLELYDCRPGIQGHWYLQSNWCQPWNWTSSMWAAPTPETSSIRFYKRRDGTVVTEPARDYLHLLHIFILAQFVLAAAPLWRDGNWAILVMTAIGTVLAIMTGSLPQWVRQKYQTQPLSDKKKKQPGSLMTFVVTRGNGHPHTFVFENMDLNLEHMAVVRPDLIRSFSIKLLMPIFASCWIILLIAVSGLEEDTWFLFGVGALGMVQNLAVAGLKRHSDAHGIPLEQGIVMEATKATGTEGLLKDGEEKKTGLGVVLLPIFFEGTILSEKSVSYWEGKKTAYEKDVREALDKTLHRKETERAMKQMEQPGTSTGQQPGIEAKEPQRRVGPSIALPWKGKKVAQPPQAREMSTGVTRNVGVLHPAAGESSSSPPTKNVTWAEKPWAEEM